MDRNVAPRVGPIVVHPNCRKCREDERLGDRRLVGKGLTPDWFEVLAQPMPLTLSISPPFFGDPHVRSATTLPIVSFVSGLCRTFVEPVSVKP